MGEDLLVTYFIAASSWYLVSAGRFTCHIFHRSLELVPGFGRKIYLSHISSQPRAGTWFRPEDLLVTYFIAASSWYLVSAGRLIHRSLELVCGKKYIKPSIRRRIFFLKNTQILEPQNSFFLKTTGRLLLSDR